LNLPKGFHEITEEDFYPPEDKRALRSGVDNIHNDDEEEFYDFIKSFFNHCEDYCDY